MMPFIFISIGIQRRRVPVENGWFAVSTQEVKRI
jgi:hypothetical protein